MFKLINFFFFFANNNKLRISWLQHVPKKLGKVAKNTEKVEECSSNTYLEHPTGEQANWEQVGAMIGYKSSFPKNAQSFTSKDGARFTTL